MAAVIYNVTVKIASDIQDEWVAWMMSEHIPEVMATACFGSYRLLHLEGYDDEEGFTYAVQYHCPNLDLFDIYQKEHAPDLQHKHKARYDGKYVAFRTLLKVVDEG